MGIFHLVAIQGIGTIVEPKILGLQLQVDQPSDEQMYGDIGPVLGLALRLISDHAFSVHCSMLLFK